VVRLPWVVVYPCQRGAEVEVVVEAAWREVEVDRLPWVVLREEAVGRLPWEEGEEVWVGVAVAWGDVKRCTNSMRRHRMSSP